MKTKHSHILMVVMVLALFFSSCRGEKDQPFITVEGTVFMLDGKQYCFMGTNFWYGAYIGAKGETGDRDRLIRELDRMKEAGITNLRVLAASEQSSLIYSVSPAFQTAPGEYNETLLDGLDFMISEMKKRDMHAVLFLNNFWQWSGGMAQYLSWANNEEIPDPDLAAEGEFSWDEFINYVSSFYTNERAVTMYYDYIGMLLNRENRYTGLKYSEEPTIMAWELANEPRPGTGQRGFDNIPAYVDWVNGTAALIKSLAPNQLVTTGSEGEMGCMGEPVCVLESHTGEHIDYISFHMWAKNWGWFDTHDIEGTMEQTLSNAEKYIERHINYASSLGKPVVLGEFGMDRDHGLFLQGTPVIARDSYFEFVFDLIFQDVGEGGPLAGSNFWGWAGEGRTVNEDFWWRTGDPFVADPPQEHQGLNSVYDADLSTIEIIKKYSDAMQDAVGSVK
jgi:mannan endo-1,4-beta-mannosidase